MKFVCAGFPKTGSKSASAALDILGFRVADYIETTEFLTKEWLEFMEGNGTIEKVIEAYAREGFDTNQDFPGNIFWEDLYRAIPDCKVRTEISSNYIKIQNISNSHACELSL